MNIFIDQKAVTLSPADLLGSGGEGNVFRWGKDGAIKIYHQPTPQRSLKLQALLSAPPQADASRLIAPQALAYDTNGDIVGFSMKRIGAGYEDLSRLAVRKYRISPRAVAGIFLDGGRTVIALHQSGYCVGDFNDFNEKYQGQAMLFLDVDAYQFGAFPCPVGAEQFLAPELYGRDLSLHPLFIPDHDWYSFAVLLFKSLLGVHPYGGTHRSIKQLTSRALQRITVLDQDVIYPQVGLPPEVVSDDLLHAFIEVFRRGKRGKFPLAILEQYAASLIDCPSCGAAYPASRGQCPVCKVRNVVPVAVRTGSLVTELLFETHGPIIFSRVIEDSVYVIAREANRDILYIWSGAAKVHELPFRGGMPRYDMIGTQVVVSQGANVSYTDLYQQVETSISAITQQAMFRGNERYGFRIAAGQILAGSIRHGQYVETVVRPVMSEQTWFMVRQDTKDKPSLCGFMQVYREQHWWMVFEGKSYDHLPLTELALNETQTDVFVRMDSKGALVMRSTQQAGIDYLHRATISETGQVQNEPRQRLTEPLPHGALYSHGVLLRPSDDGLVQERGGASKTFSQTKGVINTGDTLHEYLNGILVVKERSVTLVKLT